MNYYKLRRIVAEKTHEWVLECLKEEGNPEDFNTFCRKLNMNMGVPKSMVVKYLDEYYNCEVDENGLLKKK